MAGILVAKMPVASGDHRKLMLWIEDLGKENAEQSGSSTASTSAHKENSYDN